MAQNQELKKELKTLILILHPLVLTYSHTRVTWELIIVIIMVKSVLLSILPQIPVF